MDVPNKHYASEEAFHPIGTHRIGMSQEDEAKASSSNLRLPGATTCSTAPRMLRRPTRWSDGSRPQHLGSIIDKVFFESRGTTIEAHVVVMGC